MGLLDGTLAGHCRHQRPAVSGTVGSVRSSAMSLQCAIFVAVMLRQVKKIGTNVG